MIFGIYQLSIILSHQSVIDNCISPFLHMFVYFVRTGISSIYPSHSLCTCLELTHHLQTPTQRRASVPAHLSLPHQLRKATAHVTAGSPESPLPLHMFLSLWEKKGPELSRSLLRARLQKIRLSSGISLWNLQNIQDQKASLHWNFENVPKITKFLFFFLTNQRRLWQYVLG